MAALVCAATFLVYTPTLRHEFLNYDDDHYVTQNPAVRLGLGTSGLKWAFTSSYGANWFPLTWLSWMLDHEIYGLRASGFLLTNVLLHVLGVLLLFTAFFRMTGALAESAFVAALFAFHPLHVESVAWIAERKDVLSGLFWMSTLWTYGRYVERPTRLRYATVLLSLAFGLMAKPMLVTMPFVLLLLDRWPLGRLDRTSFRRRVLEKVPLFAVIIASSVVTYLVQRGSGAVQDLETYPFPVRVLNALNAYVAYLANSVWPHDLAVYYPHPGEAVSRAGALLGASVLIGISVVAWRTIRTRPYVFVGWFWFVGTLVPVIGLVQVGQQARADRYMYIPLVGLSLVVAWGLKDLSARIGRRLVHAVSTAVVVLLAIATLRQERVWQSSFTLFEHALAVTPENALAHSNLGVALLNAHRLEEAEPHFKEAIRIHPGSAEAHAALGALEAERGRTAEAAEHFGTALRLDPKNARAHDRFGTVLLEQGDVSQAIAHFREAIAVDPLLPEPRINLAVALLSDGNTRDATDALRVALQLDPKNPKTLTSLGTALSREGKYAEAVERFKEAAAADPAHADAHFGWGQALMNRGEFREAVPHYREAVRLKPADGEMHTGLGLALAHVGELPEAMRELSRAIEIRPEDAQAHYGLGLALANQSRFDEAIEHFRAAVERSPRHSEALFSWGLALATTGRLAEATDRFRAALAANPRYAEAQNAWAMALAQMGRVGEATEHFRAAVAIDEGNPDAHNNLGAFLARQGRLEEAEKSFARAVALRPDHPNARANLERTRAALHK